MYDFVNCTDTIGNAGALFCQPKIDHIATQQELLYWSRDWETSSFSMLKFYKVCIGYLFYPKQVHWTLLESIFFSSTKDQMSSWSDGDKWLTTILPFIEIWRGGRNSVRKLYYFNTTYRHHVTPINIRSCLNQNIQRI